MTTKKCGFPIAHESYHIIELEEGKKEKRKGEEKGMRNLDTHDQGLGIHVLVIG